MLVRVHQEQAELHAARGEFAAAFAVHKVFFAAYNDLHSEQREAQARTRQAMFETAEARQEAERFREQARRDPLTGLRNRRYVDEQLPGLIDADPELTVAIVDLDRFKRVNDLLSHDVGDQVLVLVAKLLETELAAVSPDGFVARMGGEEFLMVLPGTEVPLAALPARRHPPGGRHARLGRHHPRRPGDRQHRRGRPAGRHRTDPGRICCPLRTATSTPPSTAAATVSWRARRVMGTTGPTGTTPPRPDLRLSP